MNVKRHSIHSQCLIKPIEALCTCAPIVLGSLKKDPSRRIRMFLIRRRLLSIVLGASHRNMPYGQIGGNVGIAEGNSAAGIRKN